MKTNLSTPEPGVGSSPRNTQCATRTALPASRLTPHASRSAAFTLVELVVVIAIIALLAALFITGGPAIMKQRALKRARVELTVLEAAIENYKARLGHYPPDNAPLWSTNQLFYELLGTKLINNGATYQTLDGSAQIDTNAVRTVFAAVDGFVNCTRNAGGDEGHAAQKLLKNLRSGQFLAVTNGFSMLGSSIDGPLATGDGNGRALSPWCYNSTSPRKNQNSFDLWLDIRVGTTIYRVSNWSQTPLVNPAIYQ